MLVASCAERRAIYGCGGMVQDMMAGVRWLGVWVEGAEREKNRELLLECWKSERVRRNFCGSVPREKTGVASKASENLIGVKNTERGGTTYCRSTIYLPIYNTRKKHAFRSTYIHGCSL